MAEHSVEKDATVCEPCADGDHVFHVNGKCSLAQCACEADTEVAAPCRHCGKSPEADGDHTCTCPYPDDFCPDHPRPQDPWSPS